MRLRHAKVVVVLHYDGWKSVREEVQLSTWLAIRRQARRWPCTEFSLAALELPFNTLEVYRRFVTICLSLSRPLSSAANEKGFAF